MTTQQFNALPKAEKKRLVAKDVLAQIKKKKYIPTNRTYVQLQEELELEDTCDIKSNFNQMPSCTVCAVGSAVLSATKFANVLTFQHLEEIAGSSAFNDEEEETKAKQIDKLLLSIFSKKELAMMEMAFEGNTNEYTSSRFDYTLPQATEEKCVAFFEKYGNTNRSWWNSTNSVYEPDKTLKAIMNNIVKNGTFLP